MRNKDLIILLGVSALVMLLILSPFLPGPSNNLVLALSTAGQLTGIGGLILVPLGIAWYATERNTQPTQHKMISRWFGIGTLIVLGLLFTLPLVFLIVSGDFAEAVVYGLLYIAALLLGVRLLKRNTHNAAMTSFNMAPVYLMFVPIVAFVSGMMIMDPVSNWSRSVAIHNSTELIQEIEAYHKNEGKYPGSLSELKETHTAHLSTPGIMGVAPYRYNSMQDGYSLSFSQWLYLNSLEEIVLYDKHGLSKLYSGAKSLYDYDLDLCRVNLAYADYDAGYDHWRYYRCD